MNRRDMIIVATLMNTGLLAVLFMMAIQTESHGSVEQGFSPKNSDQSIIAESSPIPDQSKPILPHHPTVSTAKTSKHDELDKVINNYTTVVPPKPIIIEDDLFHEDQPEVSKPTVNKETQPVIKEPELLEVKVKRGDSLDKIARANKTTIKALKRANNLSSDRLQIGQILRIPEGSSKSTTPKPPKAKPASTVGAEYYTIKTGDNPWKIAKQFGVRFDELLKLNSLDEAKARRLKAGDKIPRI